MSERVPLPVRVILVVKGLTPPYLWSALKALKARTRPSHEPAYETSVAPPPPAPAPPSEWEYVPEGWSRTAGSWNVEAIARVYREKWPSFLAAVEGSGPLGV